MEVVRIFAVKGLWLDVDEVEVMPENVRFGLPPEIVQAIKPASSAPIGLNMAAVCLRVQRSVRCNGPLRIFTRAISIHPE